MPFQRVINIDLVENKEAEVNSLIDVNHSLAEQGQQIKQSLDSILGGTKLAGLFCVAGGWAGGNAASKGKRKKMISADDVLNW